MRQFPELLPKQTAAEPAYVIRDVLCGPSLCFCFQKYRPTARDDDDGPDIGGFVDYRHDVVTNITGRRGSVG